MMGPERRYLLSTHPVFETMGYYLRSGNFGRDQLRGFALNQRRRCNAAQRYGQKINSSGHSQTVHFKLLPHDSIRIKNRRAL
jgi:hypothetical protein